MLADSVAIRYAGVDRPGREKPLKEIQSEIQAIIRQITSSVSFLPMIDEPCTCSTRLPFSIAAMVLCLSAKQFLQRLLRPYSHHVVDVVGCCSLPPPYLSCPQARLTCWCTLTKKPTCRRRGRRATPSTSPTRRRCGCGRSQQRYAHLRRCGLAWQRCRRQPLDG